MPKHEDEDLVRKHLLIYKSDWEKIDQHFIKKNMGASYAIRTIIRAYFKRIEEQVNAQSRRMEASDIAGE